MSSTIRRRPVLTFYTRPGCALCKHVERLLRQLAAEGLADWHSVNIEDNPVLLARFGESIPAVAVEDGPIFEGRISEYRLRRALVSRLSASP
ncbi:MAG: glutaredoxin family protein [Ardenticatenaceae bacterium]|nr:glutaredoxin family protein [Ardenticatenaceae bacterium]